MKRREFMALLATGLAWPVAARRAATSEADDWISRQRFARALNKPPQCVPPRPKHQRLH